jgi:lipopolysaccharide transport system permease protein
MATIARSQHNSLLHQRIQPTIGWASLGLFELWGSRELLYFLVWRDIKVRYKQTLLGVTWAVLQPVFTMLVFTLFFGRVAKMPSDGIPYPLFSFAALVPWTFFASGVNLAASSLVSSAQLLKKVYFPRLAIPIAAVLAALADFGIAMLALFVLMGLYHVAPTERIIFLPVFAFLALLVSLGVGLWLAALNVRYRDIRFIVPFLTQIWMFASPVIYPSSSIPARWRTLYELNPMAAVLDGVRWSLLGKPVVSWPLTAVGFASAAAALFTGAIVFRRMERTFADIV